MVDSVELETSSEQIVGSGKMLVESEIVMPYSDLIEITAVTRTQSKQKSDNNDENHGSVTLSDDNNRMLNGIDITKFKLMQD